MPGGLIHRRGGWRVDHCTGPLPLGTLIVKPERHVLNVADLTVEEAQAMGPLLRDSAAVVHALTSAEQVYVCLWSHAGWEPGHIHFVVQPAWRTQQDISGQPGPALQAALFARGETPAEDEIEAFARRAEATFAAMVEDSRASSRALNR